MAQIRKADANPTKAFFVRMITRDISLEDCILDLIDNSVDGAWKLEGGQPMSLSNGTDLSKYKISIEAFSDRFRILDNCGGISLDDAAEYAFTFGRKDDDARDNYSIGVYGIGMKRAVFKIGTLISIRSSYKRDDGKVDSFRVPINVQEWLEENRAQQWDFDIEAAAPLPNCGVEISVSSLKEDTSTAFSNPAFIQDLRRTIARDYALHLHRGLKIEVNGVEVRGWKIELRQGGQFEPMRVDFVDETEKGSINVEILAGMAAPPPESSEPDQENEDENRFGWYVVCNGRIVLAADKSTLSGWGTDGWPSWHPQYAGFMGLIFFTSENAELLPLTTTKRSVDTSSAVYRRARPQMRDVSKQWISYTNVRKQTLEEAKKLEESAKPLSIFSVQKRQAVALPRLVAKPKIKMANIAYPMPLERVRSLALGMGDINMSYRDVGIASFEHAYSDLVGDD